MVESTRDNQDTMAVVELECSIPTCTLGPGETRWRAPALEIRCAVQVRNLHIQYNHWVELEKFHQRMEFNPYVVPDKVVDNITETSQPFLVERTMLMARFTGELVMECTSCGFIVKGFERAKLQQCMEDHIPKQVEKNQFADHGTDEQKLDPLDDTEVMKDTKTCRFDTRGVWEKYSESSGKGKQDEEKQLSLTRTWERNGTTSLLV